MTIHIQINQKVTLHSVWMYEHTYVCILLNMHRTIYICKYISRHVLYIYVDIIIMCHTTSRTSQRLYSVLDTIQFIHRWMTLEKTNDVRESIHKHISQQITTDWLTDGLVDWPCSFQWRCWIYQHSERRRLEWRANNSHRCWLTYNVVLPDGFDTTCVLNKQTQSRNKGLLFVYTYTTLYL